MLRGLTGTRGFWTYGGEVAKCEDGEKGGLAAGTVTYYDEFPTGKLLGASMIGYWDKWASYRRITELSCCDMLGQASAAISRGICVERVSLADRDPVANKCSYGANASQIETSRFKADSDEAVLGWPYVTNRDCAWSADLGRRPIDSRDVVGCETG